MSILVLDPNYAQRFRAEIEADDGSRWAEVWDGMYVLPPLPDNEHQRLAGALTCLLLQIIDAGRSTHLYAGVNVSDREEGWMQNVRCPDVALYFPENPAKDCDTHWCGGPDFLAEVVMPGDRVRDKLPFYGSLGTLEALVIDRAPWRLELYRLEGKKMVEAGRSDPLTGEAIVSSVLPVSFRLESANARPELRIAHSDGREWRL